MPHTKPYVVFVPQIIVGGVRPFWFDMLPFAQSFAEQTGGTLYELRPDTARAHHVTGHASAHAASMTA